LHDVIAGERTSVFVLRPMDPHPIAFLRVLLGTQMAVRFFGAGPWDDLARAWMHAHPIESAPRELHDFLAASVARLPQIVEVCLLRPMQAFGGRSFAAIVDPLRVRPDALENLARDAGPALFTSSHWIWTECLRLLALSGYRAATEPQRATEIAEQFEGWMLRLGRGMEAAA
jgi:hypothetical protein